MLKRVLTKDRNGKYVVAEWRWRLGINAERNSGLCDVCHADFSKKQNKAKNKKRKADPYAVSTLAPCVLVYSFPVILRPFPARICPFPKAGRTHLRPRSPLNLFTFGAAPADVGLTTFDERSVAAPRPVVRPSNLSHGATSAFRGCGPAFSPPMARRAEGGNGQSMVDAALEATLGAMLGA